MKIRASNKLLNIIFAINAAVILILDQLTKYIINNLPQSVFPIEVIPNFFYIIRITNTGAAFGLFQNRTKIFIIISIIAIILIIVLKIKMNLKIVLYNIGLGFVLGGALGNLVDRITREGEVTDFLHVVFFAVFNVADSFIVIGFGIIILVILKNFFKKGAV
ncbi:MAG: signal peptidase II [Actinomycetia bacterium]|nr:signal peptidase II [Actinomycetota bacterium]MCG2789184.1 signal peptidase II [Actinomycetes bacterium]